MARQNFKFEQLTTAPRSIPTYCLKAFLTTLNFFVAFSKSREDLAFAQSRCLSHPHLQQFHNTTPVHRIYTTSYNSPRLRPVWSDSGEFVRPGPCPIPI